MQNHSVNVEFSKAVSVKSTVLNGVIFIISMLSIPMQFLLKAHVFRDKNLHHVFVFSTSSSTPR